MEKRKRPSRFSTGGIALLVLALILAAVAWRMVGGEITRARVRTAEGLNAWRRSGGALADIAFDGGEQAGSFHLVEQAGRPAAVVDKSETAPSGASTLYRVWRLTGAGYEMLYCESVGMRANPARVGRQYASLGPEIASRYAPDNPDIAVFFAEPVRPTWQTCLILGVPLVALLLALKKLLERE